MNEDLIAPCGINCGVCRMYLSRDRSLYKSKNAGCQDCNPRGTGCKINGGCTPLNTRQVRFCFECKSFPCKTITDLEKRYAAKYHTSIIDNLETIKTKGLPAFLEQEATKWRCAACGGTVSMHTGVCIDCGKQGFN